MASAACRADPRDRDRAHRRRSTRGPAPPRRSLRLSARDAPPLCRRIVVGVANRPVDETFDAVAERRVMSSAPASSVVPTPSTCTPSQSSVRGIVGIVAPTPIEPDVLQPSADGGSGQNVAGCRTHAGEAEPSRHENPRLAGTSRFQSRNDQIGNEAFPAVNAATSSVNRASWRDTRSSKSGITSPPGSCSRIARDAHIRSRSLASPPPPALRTFALQRHRAPDRADCVRALLPGPPAATEGRRGAATDSRCVASPVALTASPGDASSGRAIRRSARSSRQPRTSARDSPWRVRADPDHTGQKDGPHPRFGASDRYRSR